MLPCSKDDHGNGKDPAVVSTWRTEACLAPWTLQGAPGHLQRLRRTAELNVGGAVGAEPTVSAFALAMSARLRVSVITVKSVCDGHQ